MAEKIKHAKVGEIMDLDEVRLALSIRTASVHCVWCMQSVLTPVSCVFGWMDGSNQVLLLGNVNQTFVGRPFVEGAVVRARVEEQTLDAKIDIFKKKRRKNYRRWNGFRRQVTVLRVTDVVPVDAA